MYRIFILSIALACTYAGLQAQNRQLAANTLPAATKAHFYKYYKGSTDVSWTVLDRLITVSFKNGETFKDSYYTPEGTWIRTETQIEITSLPKSIQEIISSDEFTGWQYGSAYLLELPGKKQQYKVYIYSKDWKELGILFNEKGKRLVDNL